ncbi:hypothetical protein DUI87_33386 [Hirundo rustica rustica]|uniref:Uncharacterized protein n=1 Tax=Hirundo rustica rustica TaxID=333673 RepID=A0A3M0IQX8_HIRRU|nr:hypothetical protein DUI87_33386 [Hirundo rustica rustica]
MLTTTSFAVSFLMLVVYAYESHRTVLGGASAAPGSAAGAEPLPGERRQGIPYVLACCSPRGGSATDIAPVVPWHGGGSNATFGLYCSSFLLTLLSFSSISPASLFVLYVTTGFLHSLAYGWMRENFRRDVLARICSLHSPGGLEAFYDDSLGAVP